MPDDPPMSALMNRLAAALQELTPNGDPAARRNEELFPACMEGGEFTLDEAVESFLERMRDYAAKTRGVHIGNY